MSTHNLLLQERRLQKEEMQKRLKAILKNPANRFCIECTEPKPTWAVLLEPPMEGGTKLGALCCFKCYSYHFRLKKTCTVKSAKMASEWTNEEISILEKTGGNLIVNSIYEAFLDSKTKQSEKADMQTFVENKYQNRNYFSEKIYHDQTTIRDINRRSTTGSKRQRSGSTHNDKKKKQEATVPLDNKEKRPTLNRSASKRSSRFLLQSMSDHLRHHQSAKKHSRSSPTPRSSSHDKQPNARVVDDPQDHNKVRRPSSSKSRSRDRLLALSDHARRSARNLKLVVERSSPPSKFPSRELAGTPGKLQVMSDHGKRSPSAAASGNGRPRSSSSHERLLVHRNAKLSHDRTKSPTPCRSNKYQDPKELRRPKRISSSGRRSTRHDEDFIPPKPRRCSRGLQAESDLPLSSLQRRRGPRETTQASTRSSFKLDKTCSSHKLDRLEQSFAKDLDASDEEGIGYDLPLYLAGHNSCPCIMDDMSDLTSSGFNTFSASASDSVGVESSTSPCKMTTDCNERYDSPIIHGALIPSNKPAVDGEQEAETQSESSSSLAAYMKRYRHSKSEVSAPLVSSSATSSASQPSVPEATSNPAVVPLRAALENLETAILGQPIMILPNRTHQDSGPLEGSFPSEDHHEDHCSASGLGGDRAAYWQAKLFPLDNGVRQANDDDFPSSDSYSFISRGAKSQKMVVASTPLSTADMKSASGRAQAA